ncbi:unnamed protein product [Paramecium octaurelia]|uniref:Uncharacterized protein n=1 Tax=Paramecium octaurelia TaxID=43137 RepID=A0A8S1U4N9_PAROT|nr:unnamed protein product [Paramecium octaurelia]
MSQIHQDKIRKAEEQIKSNYQIFTIYFNNHCSNRITIIKVKEKDDHIQKCVDIIWEQPTLSDWQDDIITCFMQILVMKQAMKY